MTTSDQLQRITLITPETTREIISELRTKLKDEELQLVDHKKIWKALFYGVAMWHCDKFFNQQTLADQISQLIRVYYPSSKRAQLYLYVRAMLFVLCNEWEKIDYWRINKFMMMFRVIQEEIMKLLRQVVWKQSIVQSLNSIYKECLLDNPLNGEGLCIHYLQIFLDCLDKNSTQITQEHIEQLLQPFVDIAHNSERKALRDKTFEYIFCALPKHPYEGFSLATYAEKIQALAQSREQLKPHNRTLLYAIVAELTNPQELEEEPIENNGVHEEIEQPEQEAEQVAIVEEKKVPKKKKRKVQPEADPVPIVMHNRSIRESEQVEEAVPLSSNLKKKSKQEKLQQKLEIKMDAEELDLEGMNYSDLRLNGEKMKQLREIMGTIPAYLFMSPAEKRKYFGNVSKQFAERIEREQGSRCTHKRKVKFDLSKVKVKEFKKTESAIRVSQTA